jgi:Domain of unknown function (DUF4350)
MKKWSQWLRRYWQVVIAAIAIVVLLIVVNAPSSNQQLSGSTYSNQPTGYGAWYQMMIDRSTPIERWQNSTKELAKTYPEGTTLLQINPATKDLNLSTTEKDWIKRGNTLIVLGVDAPPQDIEFSQDLPSAQGQVRIDTTRRLESDSLSSTLANITKVVGDQHGNVIATATLGQGQLIVATTPHLAANSYQDWRPNYELLATLATAKQQRLVVDEYLHGYRDPKSSKSADQTAPDGLTYLFQTPLAIALLNLCLVLGMVIWQQNRRFGKVVIPQPPTVENSTAYIQALGGVLRQAHSSNFVVQNIGKVEQLALQQKLGLGSQQLVDRSTLLAAWQAHPQMPTTDLPQVLQLATDQPPLTESELRQWLLQLQALRDIKL